MAQVLDKWESNLVEDLKQPLIQQLPHCNRGMQQLKGIQSLHNGHLKANDGQTDVCS